jgi:methyl-accepting chemotaxis protein
MDQVAQAMASIRTATAQNVAGIRQAVTAAEQLHGLGEKLGLLAARYKV